MSGFVILLVLGFAVVYVLVIRPQRQRQAQHQSQISSVSVGEDVLTTGGIYGTVTHAEGDDLVVEIADRVEVHMTRRGIAAVLPPEEDEEDDEEEADADADADEGEGLEDEDENGHPAERDEAAVTGEEESVTGAYDHDSASGERR